MIHGNILRYLKRLNSKKAFLNQEVRCYQNTRINMIESGRSMVEMLGVLVIMGLLSLGGIWGYQYAVSAYNAAQIQDIGAKAKVLASAKRARSTQSLEKFLNKTPMRAYQPTVEIEETTTALGRIQRIYKITLHQVPNHIQTALYARKSNFAKMDIMLAPAQDAVSKTEQNDSWIADGMSIGAYEVLSPYSAFQESEQVLLTFETFARGHSATTDMPEDTATKCPADMPFYNELTDSCSRCDSSKNAYWNPLESQCVTCDDPRNVWDNMNYICICPIGTYGENCEYCQAPREWRDEKCQCPIDSPLWYEEESTCVGCITNADCSTDYYCHTNDNIYQCRPCPDGMSRLDGEEKCHCPEDMAEVMQGNGIPMCLPYCEPDHIQPGVILFIDRSQSTHDNGLYKSIDNALNLLKLPTKLVAAVYYDVGDTNTTVANPLPFASHTYSKISYYFSYKNRGFRSTPWGTTFYTAIKHLRENVCDGRKLIMLMWTDASTLGKSAQSGDTIRLIKTECPNSKFYFIAPSGKNTTLQNVADKFFNIKNLPTDYSEVLNNELKSELCVERSEYD